MRPPFVRALALVFAAGLVACTGSSVGSARPVSASDGRIGVEEGPARGPSSEDDRWRWPAGANTSASAHAQAPHTEPYRGLGTWIDIYDDQAWLHPARTVRSMAAHGVRTIFLQTSNFHRNRPFVHPGGMQEIVDAAHRNGLEVVAWYLPGFRDLSLDAHRTLRSIRFETAAGNRFDSFALDIESSQVRRPSLRTARLLRLSARIRREVGAGYPLGAIVASPRRMRSDPGYWPGFPWRSLVDTYDVFLPMTYYTYRVSGREGAAWYTAKNVVIIRQETQGLRVPIHVVGGISFDASGPETRGFVQSIRDHDVVGASYYTFPGITDQQWRALQPLEAIG